MVLVPVTNFQQVQEMLGHIPCSVRVFTDIGESDTCKMEDGKSGYKEAEVTIRSVEKWKEKCFEGLKCNYEDRNPHYEDKSGNILYPFQTDDYIVLRYSLDGGKTPIKDNNVDSGDRQRGPLDPTNLGQSRQADQWELLEDEVDTSIQTYDDDEGGVQIEIVDSGVLIPFSAFDVHRIYVYKKVEKHSDTNATSIFTYK
ncbi:hypothetical protein COEREDRAFT_89636 [Coemansia reversa NRRL 1564]|uniref:Uncharacterized protein n=1 Tax=Coemansia reversa (strain ATCC 12441 / NRRL 1564) TaxID=763665 RepID=A0A2G5B2X9_COERN|nr:hypothetical protein COEREDRAFT_89636 [Coemansia reversa NRRL 1564]|eukprot:PIA13356.1 hypothetical protein COEREDRAFT_89636 [Coemansia reversa NRRL 1564]